jgi:hypothetical protein
MEEFKAFPVFICPRSCHLSHFYSVTLAVGYRMTPNIRTIAMNRVGPSSFLAGTHRGFGPSRQQTLSTSANNCDHLIRTEYAVFNYCGALIIQQILWKSNLTLKTRWHNDNIDMAMVVWMWYDHYRPTDPTPRSIRWSTISYIIDYGTLPLYWCRPDGTTVGSTLQ